MELNESLGYQINLVARYMKRELDNKLKKYNITTSQWSVLKVIKEEHVLMQREIATKLHSDQATAGAVIERLIKRGLLAKKVSDKDTRGYDVYLTETGTALVSKLEVLALECNNAVLDGISKDEYIQFQKIMEKLIFNLIEH